MTLLPVDMTDSVGSVHPAPLDAAASSLALAASADVTAPSTVITKTALATNAHADAPAGEQTRSPTVIEASVDSNGVTTVTPSTPPTPPSPATITSTSIEQPKLDEVRASPPPAPSVASAGSERCELEGFTPFSQCHLWKLMMSFYDREGVESWAQGIVPHFITSNTFIAKRYSNVLRAYFRDAMRPTSDHLV